MFIHVIIKRPSLDGDTVVASSESVTVWERSIILTMTEHRKLQCCLDPNESLNSQQSQESSVLLRPA